MNKDEYGEIINGNETYGEIAEILHYSHVCLIGWSDENMTHFDILFVYDQIGIPVFASQIQGGVRTRDLFVSIMRVGCFAFEVNDANTDWGYYEEKLGQRMKFGETTGSKIADLINGIRKHLYEQTRSNS